MYRSYVLFILPILFLLDISGSNLDFSSVKATKGKYKVGDTVKCSQWENESYWEGKVIKVLKDVVYQVELEKVCVIGTLKLYLNPSECTGKKRLSHEDGEDYNKTKIWVHERCLD